MATKALVGRFKFCHWDIIWENEDFVLQCWFLNDYIRETIGTILSTMSLHSREHHVCAIMSSSGHIKAVGCRTRNNPNVFYWSHRVNGYNKWNDLVSFSMALQTATPKHYTMGRRHTRGCLQKNSRWLAKPPRRIFYNRLAQYSPTQIYI